MSSIAQINESSAPLRAIVWCAVSTSEQAAEDKASLESQEYEARQLITRQGWSLADNPLIVPGHSRRYLDFHELARDARAAGIDAFDRLARHIKRRDFDVLIVRDGDRFARTQALHAFITESVIDAGARIYSLADGWIDAQNYRMFVAMSGYRSAGEVDKLVARRKMGMANRAKKGLPLSSSQILSHVWLRDDNGKVIKQVLNTELKRLWQDLAKLLLERVAYSNLEKELYRRFGHVDPATGKAYKPNRMRNAMKSPTFWGNSGRYWAHRNGEIPLYCIEPGHTLPQGVIMHYNTHDPVWSGELKDRIKAEIIRRSSLSMRAAVKQRYWYTGVFICASCRYTLVGEKKGYMRCYTRRWEKTGYRNATCKNKKQARIDYVKAWIDNALRQAVENGIVALYPAEQYPASVQNDMKALQAEITALEAQAGRLIVDKSTADPVFAAVYDEKLIAIAGSLKAKQAALAALDIEQSAMTGVMQSQQQALAELCQNSVDEFWRLDSSTQNRILLDLLGDNRIAVQDGLIIGFTSDRQHQGARRQENRQLE